MREADRRGAARGHAVGPPLHRLRVEALKPRARHLAGRLAGSLWPGGPRPVDEAWVAGILGAGELGVWRRMSGPDRRHAVGVARRADVGLGGADPVVDRRAVLAAALLHDVGKVESGLGTLARVPATVIGLAARSRARGRVAVYLDHPARGARLLREAGSAPLTVAWAAEHHLPPARWSVAPEVGAVLAAADDD